MTDAEFEAAVSKIRAGDKSGLRALYEAYGDKMYRLFLSRVHSHQDAEDLTSELFLKLWEQAGRYRPGQGHCAWMATIARNMATDFQRHHGRMMPVEDAEAAAPGALTERTTAEDTVLGDMQAADILSSLSEDEQEIVRLHIAAELTFREIAEVLRRPLGTVTWKYRRAMDRLRKLAEEGRLA